jgi:hypothetical protein
MEKIKIKGRVYITLTPAQKRRLKRVREQIAEELPDLIRRNHLADRAMKEKTLSGALRRAIQEFPLSPSKIAEKAGLTWIELEDFLTGEKPLPSDAIDRLVNVLKLKLPQISVKSKSRRANAG